ncbi:MAG TPA: hypothetical protein VNA22_07835 [Pyrinomonadaceae bacterium]|nr:hypothetical protein [Pyrinomonadaceae bacterium]
MTSRLVTLAIILSGLSVIGWAQPGTSAKNNKEVAAATQTGFRSSAAYAELLLRRTEMTSSLESLVLEYTEEYPKVKELRQGLVVIDRESDRLSKVKASDVSRLTLALGKLIVRKVELETDLWKLQKDYKDEHPDVKRAKRRVEIYESAISEILN